MDFTLRCNSLKCRRVLNDRAIVTTCSHIFCLDCSNTLGFTSAFAAERACPACGQALVNKDDAAETQLNPSEDYKTSILSGLSPTVIMECAGRGLSFYSYQVTQEVVYQEYLAKGLVDKNATLNTQMDQIINDANAEILRLRNKLSTLEIDQENLQKKNHELFEAYNQKSQAHQKTQKMYDALKKRSLQADVRHAADANEDTIDSAMLNRSTQHSESQSASQRPRMQYPVDHRGVEQLHSRQRGGASGEADQVGNVFHKPRPVFNAAWNAQDGTALGLGSTPARQRTRLPVATPQVERQQSQYGLGSVRTSTQGSLLQHGLQRQALGSMSHNMNGGNSTSYGIGANAKAGKPHRSSLLAPSFAR